MQLTNLKYLNNNNLLKDAATVLDCSQEGILVLDQTVFYPQGGGQPYDQGEIRSADGVGVFAVQEVRFKDGVVFHIGTVKQGAFSVGMPVELIVDQNRRFFHCRLHSAAHLVDCALAKLGYSLKPAKGYHFPDGPYVEYEGTLEEQERNELVSKIEHEVADMVKRDLPIELEFMDLEGLRKVCKFVPDYLPKDKPTRVWKLEGYGAIPCGGTHVISTGQVGPVTITKIKNNKGFLRVSYAL